MAGARWRLLAIVDFVEDLVSTATGSKRKIRRDRLQEDIETCIGLGRSILPLSLLFGASSSLTRQEVAPLLSRLTTLLSGSALPALDRLSETILMVDDPDLRASAAMATSVLVQRVLPADLGAQESLLIVLMEIVDIQFRGRRLRHAPIFSSLRQVEKAPTSSQLPGLLSEISDALEDLACERDVFLDNPMELTPKGRATPETPVDELKVARVQSGASLPSLGDELEQVEAIGESLGWSRDRGVELLTELYRHRVVDTRSKLGLGPAAVRNVISDVNELHGESVRDLRIEEGRTVSAPYSYDVESRTLTLNIGYRGGLTTRILEEEHPKVLEELREAKAEREATTLSKAMDRYRAAREAAGGEPVPEEDEAALIPELAVRLGVPLADAYDTMAVLYGADGVSFSGNPHAGISLQELLRLLEIAREGGTISRVAVDPTTPILVPFRVERDNQSLVLHSGFRPLTDAIFELLLRERTIDPLDIVEPSETLLEDYEDPKEAGGVARPRNIRQLIEEFTLSPDDAPDALDVLLEDSPAFRESISVQALRVVLATINSRLGPDAAVDVVTGWSRILPETQDTDRFSVAWLTSHTEGDTSLTMLTFNFSYGEKKTRVPPLSDDLLLDWCRHYRVESRGEGME